jgi:hypothetical protein
MALPARNAREGLSPIRLEPGLTGDGIVIPIPWTVANALRVGRVASFKSSTFRGMDVIDLSEAPCSRQNSQTRERDHGANGSTSRYAEKGPAGTR